LVIEAALIAADVAPGLLRTYFGFLRWRGHEAALWQGLIEEANARRAAGSLEHVSLRAYDRDPGAVRSTLDNAARAGFAKLVHAERRELADLPPAPAPRGLVVVNPPYGERIGEVTELAETYALLGRKLREGFLGWQAAVFTGNPPLGRELGLKARRTHTMYNGPIECRLLRIDIDAKHFETKRVPGAMPELNEAALARPGASMFANRLRKNAATLGAWARREAVACYRVYDADMPEYAFSIDFYADSVDANAQRWLYVQEYAPPATIDPAKARARREEAFAVIPETLGIPRERVHLRVRRK